MRQGGLKRMRRQLAEEPDEASNPLLPILATWEMRYDRLATLRCSLWERLKSRRDAWYRNLAAWLTKRYQAVCWEGDLSLQEMAATNHSLLTEAALQHAKKFRGWASLFRLRRYLQEAAAKNWCEIIAAPAAESTTTCWQCGEIMAREGGALRIECTTHGPQDQDENAAMNLLQYGVEEFSQTSGSIVHMSPWRKNGPPQWVKRVDIPDNLKAVVVLCSLE
jgi:hypothetical protein